jgi:hypothetical protein
MNAIEVLRDPSHVRDHRVDQWHAMFEGAGFTEFTDLGRWPLRMQLDAWTTRMNTPAATKAEIRRLLDLAPHEVREALHVEPDYHFSIPVALMRGRR